MTDVLSTLTGRVGYLNGIPVVLTTALRHGQMMHAGSMLLVGVQPLTRAERIARAARHEARLVFRAAARELGYDAPDPSDRVTGGHLPADSKQVYDGGPWRWPDLDAELDAWADDLRVRW